MRGAAIILLASMLGATLSQPVEAIMAVPPQFVGPRSTIFRSQCPMSFTVLDGNTLGVDVPVPTLRLGAPVTRAGVSFPTGGSGTARMMERQRRKNAGQSYEPVTFDTSLRLRPSVFAVQLPTPLTALVFQRFPLKPVNENYWPSGMIFAQETSKDLGRIAAISLTLPKKPIAAPRLRISTNGQPGDRCYHEPVDVYAPAMTANLVAKLSTPSGCGWNTLAACTKRTDWPHGQVLFVQQTRDGTGYEHRWIDYDLLARGHFGKQT